MEHPEQFKFASDLVSQLISLSTGVVALMLTYMSGERRGDSPPLQRAVAIASFAFLVSIALGILAGMAITGVVAKGGSIYDSSVRIFSIAQVLAFLVALALTIRVGVMSMKASTPREAEPSSGPASARTEGDDERPKSSRVA